MYKQVISDLNYHENEIIGLVEELIRNRLEDEELRVKTAKSIIKDVFTSLRMLISLVETKTRK